MSARKSSRATKKPLRFRDDDDDDDDDEEDAPQRASRASINKNVQGVQSSSKNRSQNKGASSSVPSAQSKPNKVSNATKNKASAQGNSSSGQGSANVDNEDDDEDDEDYDPNADEDEDEDDEDNDGDPGDDDDDDIFTSIQNSLNNGPPIISFAHKTWKTTLRLYAHVRNVVNNKIKLHLGLYFKAINHPNPLLNMEQDGNNMEYVLIHKSHLRRWNIELINSDNFPWMTKRFRLVEYNQFWLFQHAHLKAFRLNFLNPLRLHMIDQRGSVAHFRAWLVYPLLYRMQLERSRVMWRETLDPRTYAMMTDPELDEPEQNHPIDQTVEQDPMDANRLQFVLDRITQPMIELDPSQCTVDQLIRRMDVTSWVLTNAIVIEMASIVFEATRLRRNILDDDNDEESLFFIDKVFPVGMESAFHWVNVELRGVGSKPSFRQQEFVKYAKIVEIPQNDIVLQRFLTEKDFKRNAFQNWRETQDVIYTIERSNLLIRPQIQTLDSYIGTRVHLRLATFPVVQQIVNNQAVLLKNTILFGPSIAIERQGVYAPQPAPAAGAQAGAQAGGVAPIYSKDNAGVTQIESLDLYNYIVAEPVDDLYVKNFCKPIELLLGNDELKNLCTFEENDRATDVKLLSTEYPIFHPFCMFWNQRQHVFKFYTTQIDFILHATYASGSKGVIIGEYKTLIENRKPTDRIINTKTFSQALCNAIIFELQTGIKVMGVLILYTTRQKTAYAARMHLDDNGRMNRAFVELEKVITMKPRFAKSEGIVYYDGRCLMSHTSPAFPHVKYMGPYQMLPRLSILPTRYRVNTDTSPFVDDQNVPVVWWNQANQPPFGPNFTWLRYRARSAEVVNIVDQVLRVDTFIALTWSGQNNAPVYGNVVAPAPAAPVAVPVAVAFLAPQPARLGARATRHYPRSEIVQHETDRLQLNSQIVDSIIQRSRIPYVVIALNRAIPKLQKFWKHMISMDIFKNGTYTRANGASANVDRTMRSHLYNPKPNFSQAQTPIEKKQVILEILIRTAQRYENVLVAQLNNAQPPGGQLQLNMRPGVPLQDDPKTLSIKFVHNSQRAFWDDALLDFGNRFGAPLAVNEVILHALTFH